MANRIAAQMKPHKCNLFDPISNIRLFQNFKLAYDTNGFHEGAVMRLFNFSLTRPRPLC